MRTRSHLQLESLEERCNPSSLGQPWPSPGHLTLSFAPDGTSINGAPSSLFQTLNHAAPTAQWEQVLLQAFQTWVANTNVNIGLVPDGGQAFGVDGAVQGDTRFGDIRIGMAALPANLVATTSPFSWTGSTWSGDMILNSSYSFGVNGSGQYDLFTVALHEAGHALGLANNSTDVGSIMYANYTGPRTGLDGLDVANIQAMYGVRTPDAQSNNSLATATPIGNSPTQLGFNADLSAATDVDYYKITTPLLALPGSVTFQINAAGESLLTPTLSVYNAFGRLVATQTAPSPFSNTVSVTVSNVFPLTTLYFEVSHASSDGFGVGVYSAQITYKNPLSVVTGIVPSLVDGVVNTVNHLNTSITSATMLTASLGQGSDQRFDYLYQANIVTGGDADYYQFKAPAPPAGTSNYSLDAIVWQTAPGGLAPVIHLFDANGKPIAAQVLANSDSVYSIQLSGVTAGEVFYVEVAGQTANGTGSSGGYVLGIKFNTLPETVAPPLGSNTLPTAASTDAGTLSMNQNGVFYFELAAANGSPSVSSNLTMTVRDANGNVVLSLTAPTGSAPKTAAVYLAAGSYTIDYSISSTTGTYLPVSYWLSGETLSDPIGPYYASPSTTPSRSTTTTTTTSPPSSGNSTVSSTATFASSGASVSITTAMGSMNMTIPPPGGTSTQSFTTAQGTTTVTMTTASNGNTTLTLTTYSSNTITDTTTTSGNTSTETLATSDGIRVSITTPMTTSAPVYSGPSSGTAPPYYY